MPSPGIRPTALIDFRSPDEGVAPLRVAFGAPREVLRATSLDAVVQSLVAFPVGPEPFAFLHAVRPETWGAEIFRLGLWIALPLIAMLLFVNMMLGIIARVAPQLSIFSVGFPITLGVGLVGVMFTLPLLQGPFTAALEQMLVMFR